jgi:predicted enzyme related to lactoylglutathione lyase
MTPGKVQAVVERDMDFETVKPEDFGASLRGLGLNLLVRDVLAEVAFLRDVFDMQAHRVSKDFAIMAYGNALFQLHADGTYHANPLLHLLPENPPRGAGLEIRLYDSDPDAACTKAEAVGGTILQAPTDKPHGLREAYILCPDGYAWVPSRVL